MRSRWKWQHCPAKGGKGGGGRWKVHATISCDGTEHKICFLSTRCTLPEEFAFSVAKVPWEGEKLECKLDLDLKFFWQLKTSKLVFSLYLLILKIFKHFKCTSFLVLNELMSSDYWSIECFNVKSANDRVQNNSIYFHLFSFLFWTISVFLHFIVFFKLLLSI